LNGVSVDNTALGIHCLRYVALYSLDHLTAVRTANLEKVDKRESVRYYLSKRDYSSGEQVL